MKMKLAIMLALASTLFGAHAALYTTGAISDPIADSPANGTAAGIVVTGPGVVGAVNGVTFSLAGGWAGDYTVALQYTDGSVTKSTTLFANLLGGNAANNGFNNVTLTASTGSSISGTGTAYTGGSMPAALTGTFSGVDYSTFNGVSAGGDWTLFVTDTQSGETGTLTGFSLDLNVVPEPVNVALGIFAGAFGLRVLGRSNRFKNLLSRKNRSVA